MGFGIKKKEFAKVKIGKDKKGRRGIKFVKGENNLFDVPNNVKNLRLDGKRG